MNLLLEAREIVRTQPPSTAVMHLHAVADEFDTAYRRLRLRCDRENIIEFVAQSTRLCRAIDAIHASTSPPPKSGAAREPQEQVA